MTALERPTTGGPARDVSAPASGSSTAPSAPSEDELFHGYIGKRTLQQRSCVCGGTVTADRERPALGVTAHQFTARHKGWRQAHDL